MLRRVALVRTDISEELSSSFIRVTRIGELETTLAVSSNRNSNRDPSVAQPVASGCTDCAVRSPLAGSVSIKFAVKVLSDGFAGMVSNGRNVCQA
jgi:hypothetical protein